MSEQPTANPLRCKCHDGDAHKYGRCFYPCHTKRDQDASKREYREKGYLTIMDTWGSWRFR